MATVQLHLCREGLGLLELGLGPGRGSPPPARFELRAAQLAPKGRGLALRRCVPRLAAAVRRAGVLHLLLLADVQRLQHHQLRRLFCCFLRGAPAPSPLRGRCRLLQHQHQHHTEPGAVASTSTSAGLDRPDDGALSGPDAPQSLLPAREKPPSTRRSMSSPIRRRLGVATVTVAVRCFFARNCGI